MRLQPLILAAVTLGLPAFAWGQTGDTGDAVTGEITPAAAAVTPPTETPAAPADGPTPMDLATEDHASTDLDTAAAEFLSESDADEPSLRIYGFADFNAQRLFIDRNSSWATFMSRTTSFLIGNLNLYLDAQLSSKWRSLIEVRFMYVPHGTYYADNNATLQYRDKKVFDPISGSDTVQWGSIGIERAWIEYEAHELLIIRGGSWLTPYGIWNVDHGSPVLIGAQAPWIVGEELLPERQSGIQVRGGRYFGGTKLGYHLTFSNGRGPIDTWQDLDKNWGYGGRLFVETDAVGSLVVGTSAFGGRYTDAVKTVVPIFDESGEFTRLGSTRDVREQYDELAFALDLRWEWHDLLVAAEFAHKQFAYTAKGRPPLAGVSFNGVGAPVDESRLAPDDRTFGGYVLLAYRLPWNLRPFAILEYFSRSATQIGDTLVIHGGLNVEILPGLVGKAEYQVATWVDTLEDGFHNFPIGALSLQIAWAF